MGPARNHAAPGQWLETRRRRDRVAGLPRGQSRLHDRQAGRPLRRLGDRANESLHPQAYGLMGRAPTPTLPRKRGREGPAPQAWEGGGYAHRDAQRLTPMRGLLGIAAILVFAWALSEQRWRVPWRV